MIPKEKIITALLEQPSIAKAAKSLGISRVALYKRAENDNEIAKTLKLLAKDRTSKSKRIDIRVSPEIYKGLEVKAKEQNTTITEYCRGILEASSQKS